MHISIIGTGRMAKQLALGWLKAGHRVQFGSRDPQSKADLLAQVQGVSIATIEAAIAAAEVVVLGIPFATVKPFAEQHAALLRPKLVIDISNSFEHLPDNRISGPEITAQALGDGARVVAAFKANFWQTLLEPLDPETSIRRDVHYVGDSASDKAIVAQLIRDLGFEPVDCGALRNARVLDGMVPLIVELARAHGGNYGLSWKLLG